MLFGCYLAGILHTGRRKTNDSQKGSTVDIDFDSQPTVSDYCAVPAGRYLVRIAEVRPGTTRNGDERWSLRLVVAEGEHVGSLAAWDSLVFSTRGHARVRSVFHALGLPTKGKVRMQPEDLQDRRVFAELRPSEFEQPSGVRVRRNEVPYNGYSKAPDPEPEPQIDSQDIPF